MDVTDARLLAALNQNPRATAMSLAESTGLSRNTVQARLLRLEGSGEADRPGRLGAFERRIQPEQLGYPLTAFVTATLVQQHLDAVADELVTIPEVLEVAGVSGSFDLVIRVAARDSDDLYRIAGRILAIRGVDRTETSIVMRRMVDYRVAPLLDRIMS